jgi:hypothetical protein
MRQLAQEALTESLRKGCLTAAQEYERLAEQVDEGATPDQQ